MFTDRQVMEATFNAIGMLYARQFGETMQVKVVTEEGYIMIAGPVLEAPDANSREPSAKPRSWRQRLCAILK